MQRTAVTRAQCRRLQAAIKLEIARLERCLHLFAKAHPELYKAGMDVFESEREFAFWLCEPNPSLCDRLPLVVAKTKAGRKAVLNTLGAIEHGVFF